ncbi:MAG: hypothetical protein M5R40_05200 [Anaerolineae bacterium]|nr:hypothetical protein [Anaerolineae bacterium]
MARDSFIFPPDYSGALIDHNLSDRVTLPASRRSWRLALPSFAPAPASTR